MIIFFKDMYVMVSELVPFLWSPGNLVKHYERSFVIKIIESEYHRRTGGIKYCYRWDTSHVYGKRHGVWHKAHINFTMGIVMSLREIDLQAETYYDCENGVYDLFTQYAINSNIINYHTFRTCNSGMPLLQERNSLKFLL